MRCSSWLTLALLLAACTPPQPPSDAPEPPGPAAPAVSTGAEVLLAEPPEWLRRERVALLTNRGARVGERPLWEALAEVADLVRLFAPEHGLDLALEAGAEVEDAPAEGARVETRSWYGASHEQRVSDLEGVDVLLFDLPDVGARYFTYVGTMHLAMQAAAEAGVRFVVLDRPNPLGGERMAGWIVEPELRSLVAALPVPVVHGMTVGELAGMIVGEGWLEAPREAAPLVLEVVAVRGWRRDMSWPETGLTWGAPSPNLPAFEAALLYPGACLLDGTTIAEGRGTELSFLQLGAPWIDAEALAAALEGRLPGVVAQPVRYTPRALPGRAESPRHLGAEVAGVRLEVIDPGAVDPLGLGVVLLERILALDGAPPADEILAPEWLARLAGTPELAERLAAGETAERIAGSWRRDVEEFALRRAPYLLYP